MILVPKRQAHFPLPIPTNLCRWNHRRWPENAKIRSVSTQFLTEFSPAISPSSGHQTGRLRPVGVCPSPSKIYFEDYFAQARRSLPRPLGDDLFCPGPSEFVQALRRFILRIILPRPVGVCPGPSEIDLFCPGPSEFAQTPRRWIYFAQARRSLSKPFGLFILPRPVGVCPGPSDVFLIRCLEEKMELI
ncbi:hypothetical protein ACE6H2_005398 [Prunus campanulata]